MIDITLSYPQLRFCRQLIDALSVLGDCKLHGFTVSFESIDKATVFLHNLYGIRTATTREYVTQQAIEAKLDKAIKRQQPRLNLRRSA